MSQPPLTPYVRNLVIVEAERDLILLHPSRYQHVGYPSYVALS